MNGARRGFTLREIAIVLVVLAVTAAVAVPAFARLGKDAPARPADPLIAVLDAARRTAVEHGVAVRVVLDPVSGRFRVDTTGIGGSGIVADTVLELESGTTIITDSLRASFVFRPNGAAIADSAVIQSPQATVVVRVDAWNGQVYADDAR